MVYSAAAGDPNPRRPTLMPIDSKTSCIQPPRFHKKSITGTFMRMQINIFYANSLVCKQTYGTVSKHVSVSDQLYIQRKNPGYGVMVLRISAKIVLTLFFIRSIYVFCFKYGRICCSGG